MGTVKCFEDFKIWQDARLLVNQVYLYTTVEKYEGWIEILKNEKFTNHWRGRLYRFTSGSANGKQISGISCDQFG